MPTLVTTNHHDDGYDLAEGPLVTGPVVGRIYWEDTADNAGYVLRIDGAESYPNGITEIEGELAALGYDLESTSRDELIALEGESPTP